MWNNGTFAPFENNAVLYLGTMGLSRHKPMYNYIGL